jgi:transcriptional regulator with XRE-family HTH domain
MKDFLERLNICRNGRNVSEFARILGINQKTLDFYIKGERKPSVELIISVCSKCNVSANWLLGLPEHSENAESQVRAANAERQLARINKALGHILKGTNELQAIIEEGE